MSSLPFPFSSASSSLSLPGFIFPYPHPVSTYTCIASWCLCLWLMCTPESSQDVHRCRISGCEAEAAGSPRTLRPASGTLTPGCLLHRLGPDRYIPINQSTFVACESCDSQQCRRCERFYDLPVGLAGKMLSPLGGGVSDPGSCCVSWNSGTHLVWEISTRLCANIRLFYLHGNALKFSEFLFFSAAFIYYFVYFVQLSRTYFNNSNI